MRYEGRHEPCGTLVADELPEGYPVGEGVGLWCPRCRESFWSRPAPEPVAPSPEFLSQSEKKSGLTEKPQRRAPVRTAAAVALLAAAAGVTALLTGHGEPPPRSTPTPTPTPRPTATATATATPAPQRRIVTRGRVTAVLQPGWHASRAGRNRVAYTGPRGERVTVSSAPRRGRSLRQLGVDTRAALHPRRHVPLRPVRQGGRRALRVTAHGREVTAIVLGRERWIIARDVADGGRRVARSVRIR